MPVLILSTRADERRRARLQAIVRAVGEPVVFGPDSTLPDLWRFGAIVLDGDPSAWGSRLGRELARVVEAGASLLTLGWAPGPTEREWVPILATTAGAVTQAGEVFARVTGAGSPLTVRLPAEFPIVDRFTPLAPADDATVAIAVRIGLRDLPAVVEAVRGRGRVVTCSLGASEEALEVGALARLIRRALRSREAGERPGRNIGVGIVGYGPLGGMGYHHGLATGATAGLELVAVAEPDVDRRKTAEGDFPGIRAFASVEDLCEDDDVELVFVATPPVHHASISAKLLTAGKHVACEKPLCFAEAEVDRLIALAGRNRLVLTVHQNRRWDPDFVAIMRAVDGGLLGQVFNVETFVGSFEHPCRTWHSDASVSGGAVYDWGAHHLDWILRICGGPPLAVRAHGHKRVWHDVTNLDQIRVRLTWPDGREGEFVHSDVAAVRRPKFYLQGTAGTLVGHYRPVVFERILPGRGYVAEPAHHAEAPAELVLARYESGYGVSETRLPPAPVEPFAFHRNLADHLHLGEPLAVTPESVRDVVAVLAAAERSSREGGASVTLASTSG